MELSSLLLPVNVVICIKNSAITLNYQVMGNLDLSSEQYELLIFWNDIT